MFDTVFARDVQNMLDHFRRSVDQLFGNTFGTPYTSTGNNVQQQPGTEQVFSPVIESGWNEHELSLRAILPGVTDKDVTVNLRGGQLVIEGERKAPGNWTKGSYPQLAYGKFYAAITLPQGLNFEKLSCRLHDGVLDVTVPLAEQMKPRQIPINVSNAKEISA
jgi:HSP20 family protein